MLQTLRSLERKFFLLSSSNQSALGSIPNKQNVVQFQSIPADTIGQGESESAVLKLGRSHEAKGVSWCRLHACKSLSMASHDTIPQIDAKLGRTIQGW